MTRLHPSFASVAAAAATAVATVSLLLVTAPARAAGAPAPEPRAGWPEAAVEHTIVEDDGVRIEEVRVRGEAQRVTVQTKGPLKNRYEIVVPYRGSAGALAGQRVWHVLSF